LEAEQILEASVTGYALAVALNLFTVPPNVPFLTRWRAAGWRAATTPCWSAAA